MKHFRKYCLGLLIFSGLAVMAFAGGGAAETLPFPTPLDAYGDADLIKRGEIMAVLSNRVGHSPFNLFVSLIFLFAIIHTFFAGKFTGIAEKMEHMHADQMRAEGKSEEDIEKMVNDAEKYKEEDEINQKKVMIKNQIQS